MLSDSTLKLTLRYSCRHEATQSGAPLRVASKPACLVAAGADAMRTRSWAHRPVARIGVKTSPSVIWGGGPTGP
jgi:hypothetical protein